MEGGRREGKEQRIGGTKEMAMAVMVEKPGDSWCQF